MAARDQVKAKVKRASSRFDGRPKVKQGNATQVFVCYWLTQGHKPQATSFMAYDWTTRHSRISPVCLTRRAPHISLSIQWLRITVSSRRVEPSVFFVDTCQVNASKDLLHTYAYLWGIDYVPYLAHILC